jgi:ribosomal protein S18 acetylase RimI-like enzyme
MPSRSEVSSPTGARRRDVGAAPAAARATPISSGDPANTDRDEVATMYPIESCRPDHPDAIALLDRLSATLAALTGASGRASFDPADVVGPGAAFVIARDDAATAVGCGGYRPVEPGIAEMKRVYAAPGTRGLGAALLAHLERRAIADGYRAIRVETRAVNQRAVRFYERHGFRRIANYGRYVGRPEAVCFEKSLEGSDDGSGGRPVATGK